MEISVTPELEPVFLGNRNYIIRDFPARLFQSKRFII
jgi:hypothetical protein